EDYIVGEWTWVDLTSFGPAVKSLHFSLSSSDNGAWGMNTPAYYAIDDLQFIYTFSESGADSDLYDAAVPGFVGPGGDGNPDGVSNYVNRAFAGWAASVVDYSPTPDVAAEWTNTLWTLGPVTGTNTHIAALGDLTQEQIDGGMSPGSITLEMEVAISDEAGPDFAVFENALLMGDLTFADLGYVEVSSDGTNFTRFSTACLSTNPVGAYDGLDERYYHGFCGKHLNAYGSSWGTPFDLGELACHPDVQNGTLNLTNVNYVRIVDVPGNGSYFDSAVPANAVYDPWHTFGSGGVDLEAVGVINSPLYARVETTAIGPGQIAPYGMPDGLVAVPLGSNVTFSIAASSGYHLVDVLVNGESQGPIASHTFTGVSSDQSLTAIFGSELLIESLYGESAPLAGTRYGYGPFSVSLVDSPVTMGTTQYVCLGWIGSGSVPTNGVGVEATFSLTNDSTLTWVWGTNYWLDSESDGAGSVDPADGWFAAGQSVTSTATADPYYEFGGWSGDVKGDTNSASIAIAIDGPSSLVAHFWAESATNGVPLAWLDAYGLTNGMPDDIAMSDRFGKGMLLWEEFYAGTDPNDPNSIFAIVDTGMSGVSNYVSWTGGTNGSVLPFAVLGCPDLTSTWTVLDGNVERSPTGTNVWWGTPTESNLFYRIDVNTGQ
ncbi:MAG: DUF4465 domain-containing protein, partial [Verrucomicrobia bacterium]|nr:DUF4465 domain-containing protein [Verrucomicrobiota bacterium]